MKIKNRILGLIVKHSFLIIVIVLAITTYAVSRDQLIDVYKTASSLGHTAADMLDGDEMVRYAKTLEIDEAYVQTEAKLTRLKSNFEECQYMYVLVPNDDQKSATYVFDIYSHEDIEEEEDESELGTVEPFTEESYGSALLLYKTGKESNELDVDLFSEYGSLVSCYAPVLGKDGKIKAIIGIDYSISDFLSFISKTIFGVLCLYIVMAGFLARLELKSIEKLIVIPIQTMGEKISAFANSKHDGNSSQYHIEEKENSQNELDILAHDMNRMMKDIDTYIQNIELITSERERISAELALAEKIQRSTLPSEFPAFEDVKEFDLYATMKTAKEVGGDFYDFYFIDDIHLALIIADVSGKGVGAALFMMTAKTLIKSQAMVNRSPAEILKVVNTSLCENNEAEMFVTAWLGILDIKSGLLTAANAGHEYPYLKRNGKDFEIFKDKHGLVLGGIPDIQYREYVIQLKKDDVLYVYTDGVTEATNKQKELFGNERVLKALNTHKDKDMMGLLQGMAHEIDDFVGECDQFDDITMLAILYKGEQEVI